MAASLGNKREKPISPDEAYTDEHVPRYVFKFAWRSLEIDKEKKNDNTLLFQVRFSLIR